MKTTFSRRELYALGEPIGDSATVHKVGGGRIYGMGGGGGGGQPNQTYTQTSNIPEYAQPYVEQMLGAAQKQIFNYEKDAEGNMVPTTMKGYKPFNADPNAYFAGFQPLQERAFQGAREMQVRPETQDAAGLAGRVGLSAMGTTYDPLRAQSQQFGQDQAQQYMSPYMQSVVDIQQAAAQRQADIAGTSRGAQAVQAGAFGGSRQAIMDAEAARALADQKGAIQAQGLQSAYSQAQQQFNADQAQRMQAQMANIGQQQFGANLGMQGLQTGLQAAGTMGQMGQNIYGQQMGINQLQAQLGGQQQAFEQSKINQQIQDYATAQQYPMMQLGNMSALTRGLPMQSSTTSMYQAAPSPMSQLAGLGTAAYGLSQLGGFGSTSTNKAKGGQIKEKRPAGLAELALMKMQ
jgi:hypothetical protein